ncbi:MAG: toxin-antitoxin system TumE family protein [Burkholderiales bacterium]
MKRDPSLDTLLDLDGQVIGGLRSGYWVKFEVAKAVATVHRPHGIRYSLTLHDASGRRIFGIDNAHGFEVKAGVRKIRSKTFDHVHKSATDRGSIYEYRDAGKLVEDFWAAVDKILGDS